MNITPQECETLLSRMEDADLARFLPLFGHELTVIARTAYEFQGPGVTDPRFLREINEIQHRIFGQLMAIGRGNRSSYLPLDVLASWLLADNKTPRLKLEVAHALGRAFQRFRAAA
jgi:hypothetical protein